MSVLNKEFLTGVIRATNTIEAENGYIEHHLLPLLTELISLTEQLLIADPELSSYAVWGELIKDKKIRAYLEEHYGRTYDSEPRMMLNSLASQLIYGNADFLNRVGPLLMNENDVSLLKDLFSWLKWDVSLNSGIDFLNLLKMAAISYPFLMFEQPVKEWVVDYRKIQQQFLEAEEHGFKSAAEVGVFKQLANFLVSVRDQVKS
ncbi:MAG: hypothetical protein ACOZAK_01375 [Patescibacteria group bacterium]